MNFISTGDSKIGVIDEIERKRDNGKNFINQV